MSVYGTRASARKHAFSWERVDVIYPQLIRGFNQTCFGGLEHVYRRPIVGATFVDYPERSKIVHGALQNMGGPRVAPKARVWPWTEVLHSPSWGRGMVDEQLWLYIAKGSGLWFNPGKVLEFSDTFDLAAYLNMSRVYNTHSVWSKGDILNRGVHAFQTRHCLIDSLADIKCTCRPSLQHQHGSPGSLTALLLHIMWTAAAAIAW